MKGRRPCPCIKEPFRPRSIVSIFKVPWCLGRDESRAFWEAPAMTMPTLKSFLFSFLCLTLVLKPSMHEAHWSLAVPLVVVHRLYIEALSCIGHSWLALSFQWWSFVILMVLLNRSQRPSLSKLHLLLFYSSVGDELTKSIDAVNVTVFSVALLCLK